MLKPQHIKNQELSSTPKLLLFDLDLGGHHGSYIQHLIEFFHEKYLPISLDIVVRPEFLQIHSDPVNLVSQSQVPNVRFLTITPDEAASIGLGRSKFERFARNFKRWNLFCKYATQLAATQALHMYFDTCELPLAFGAKSPCPFSGIYFRPTFHYGEFANYPLSWKNRIQHKKEKFVLNRVLQHSQLKTIFCLDQFAVKHFERSQTKGKVIYLPDPVQLQNPSSLSLPLLREQLGIQPNRQIFLLFGALNGRKGIYQLLEAISQLPDDLCQRICLVLVGEANALEQRQIEAKVLSVCQTRPVQVVEHYKFVPESDVSSYFQLADIVLAPYQQHVGMSGILLLAAAAGKPVLSSDYGLMGEIVRRYHLGLVVDSTIPSAIAQGLTQCLLNPLETLGSPTQMKTFAEQHSNEHYVNTIFEHLGYLAS
jgi:glycosyltransferase involved in cell wall biosynthesis